jgi:hypothetical protein
VLANSYQKSICGMHHSCNRGEQSHCDRAIHLFAASVPGGDLSSRIMNAFWGAGKAGYLDERCALPAKMPAMRSIAKRALSPEQGE